LGDQRSLERARRARDHTTWSVGLPKVHLPFLAGNERTLLPGFCRVRTCPTGTLWRVKQTRRACWRRSGGAHVD